ncbi:MAG TPA: hypothetical protein VF614_15105 [Chthoniobacteraceae bacterium]|jgi:hypothetical protein
MWTIQKDGYSFRAVNEALGFRSMGFTSASQAGLMIQRKAGKDAHRAAAEEFLASLKA